MVLLKPEATHVEVSSTLKFVRSLGSFEELLWQMDKQSPLHATLVAHVDGSTTIQQWREALEQTRQRHPLWSMVIAQNMGDRPYFQWMHNARVELRVIEGVRTHSWEKEVARELAMPIYAAKGPMVRAVLMHAEASCILILSAHHSICDGMSLAFAFRDVLQAISGRKLQDLNMLASQEDTLGLHPEVEVRRRSLEGRPDQPVVSTVFRPTTLTEPSVHSRLLSAALTTRLRTRAKDERTTVHGALMAACGIAARRHSSYATGRDLRLCSTISNRRLMGFPEDCSVLFTACGFALAENAKDDFWSLARRCKDTLHAGQTEEGVKAMLGAVDGIVQSGIDAYAAGEEGGRLFLFDIHLSNLGVVPIETVYGDLLLRELWGPAVLVGFDGEQTLGISTVNGQLALLHTSHSPLADFLGQVEGLLTEASAS